MHTQLIEELERVVIGVRHFLIFAGIIAPVVLENSLVIYIPHFTVVQRHWYVWLTLLVILSSVFSEDPQ